METNYSAEQILSLYGQIQYGQTRQIKSEANMQIMVFLESAQAWKVATQLLTAERPTQE
jgi:hypothetical protein